MQPRRRPRRNPLPFGEGAGGIPACTSLVRDRGALGGAGGVEDRAVLAVGDEVEFGRDRPGREVLPLGAVEREAAGGAGGLRPRERDGASVAAAINPPSNAKLWRLLGAIAFEDFTDGGNALRNRVLK